MIQSIMNKKEKLSSLGKSVERDFERQFNAYSQDLPLMQASASILPDSLSQLEADVLHWLESVKKLTERSVDKRGVYPHLDLEQNQSDQTAFRQKQALAFPLQNTYNQMGDRLKELLDTLPSQTIESETSKKVENNFISKPGGAIKPVEKERMDYENKTSQKQETSNRSIKHDSMISGTNSSSKTIKKDRTTSTSPLGSLSDLSKWLASDKNYIDLQTQTENLSALDEAPLLKPEKEKDVLHTEGKLSTRNQDKIDPDEQKTLDGLDWLSQFFLSPELEAGKKSVEEDSRLLTPFNGFQDLTSLLQEPPKENRGTQNTGAEGVIAGKENSLLANGNSESPAFETKNSSAKLDIEQLYEELTEKLQQEYKRFYAR